jgi:3-oxoacyl-[acyl-carrier-protein] synthase-3
MAVPEAILSNADLERMVETSDEWIVSRTGIRERRIAGPDESSTSLSLAAAREALDRAGVSPTDIDLIICSTCTGDQLLVSQASLLQAELGGTAGAFDLGAACSGFVYALSVASQFIENGAATRILVVGVDTLTRYIDFTDRSTCVLFGDGAGAVVLEATTADRGLLASVLGADGTRWDSLYVPGWSYPAASPDAGVNGAAAAGGEAEFAVATMAPAIAPAAAAIEQRPALAANPAMLMNGGEVFKFAVKVLAESAAQVVEKAGLSLEDVDVVVPHQANVRIIDAASRRLGIAMDRFVVNVDRYGNTSAASVPMALYEAAEDGRLNDGDNVVCVGFGAGLSWAAVALRWGAGREPSS